MTHAPWHIGILIPARNEEELLPRCLRSVLAAQALLPAFVTCDIVVAVDCSIDQTRQIARRMLQGRGAVVCTQVGAVGQARALAAQAALARYRETSSHPWARCWLANTDADCCVPETWLSDQIALAAENVEAVAGTVDVDTFEEHDAQVADRFRETYLLSPDGSHGHVHGANLGVRADAYLRAGGWGTLATAEDHDLWSRLTAVTTQRRSPSRLRVLTSGRRVGRAPRGFAEALAAHNETAA